VRHIDDSKRVLFWRMTYVPIGIIALFVDSSVATMAECSKVLEEKLTLESAAQ
jgi:hypothetical protein